MIMVILIRKVVITIKLDLKLGFSGLSFADAEGHINKMPFSGNCMFVNKPSDATPCGSDKPCMFPLEVVNKSLPTFIGMGVDVVYADDWYGDNPAEALTGHDSRFKIGIVESASIVEDAVNVTGILWQRDFYDVCYMIKNAKDALGFSIEVCVNDMEETDEYWIIKDFTFTGVAILYKNLAAFQNTALQAKAKHKEDERVNEEQLKQITDLISGVGVSFSEAMKSLEEKFDAKVGELETKISEVGKVEATVDFSSVEAKIAEVMTKVDEMKPKTPDEPARKTDVFAFAKKFDENGKLNKDVSYKAIDEDASLSRDEKVKAKMAIFNAKEE